MLSTTNDQGEVLFQKLQSSFKEIFGGTGENQSTDSAVVTEKNVGTGQDREK